MTSLVEKVADAIEMASDMEGYNPEAARAAIQVVLREQLGWAKNGTLLPNNLIQAFETIILSFAKHHNIPLSEENE